MPNIGKTHGHCPVKTRRQTGISKFTVRHASGGEFTGSVSNFEQAAGLAMRTTNDGGEPVAWRVCYYLGTDPAVGPGGHRVTRYANPFSNSSYPVSYIN